MNEIESKVPRQSNGQTINIHIITPSLVCLVVLVATMTGCLNDEEDWETTVKAWVVVVDQDGDAKVNCKVNLEVWYLGDKQLSDVDPIKPGKKVHENSNETNNRGLTMFNFSVSKEGNYLIRAMVVFTYWIDDERGVKDEVTFKANSNVKYLDEDLKITV